MRDWGSGSSPQTQIYLKLYFCLTQNYLNSYALPVYVRFRYTKCSKRLKRGKHFKKYNLNNIFFYNFQDLNLMMSNFMHIF